MENKISKCGAYYEYLEGNSKLNSDGFKTISDLPFSQFLKSELVTSSIGILEKTQPLQQDISWDSLFPMETQKIYPFLNHFLVVDQMIIEHGKYIDWVQEAVVQQMNLMKVILK